MGVMGFEPQFPNIGEISKGLEKILSLAISVVVKVLEVLIGILKAIDLVINDDDVEDLGEKAFQTEKNPDESYEDYFKRMQETEVDPETSKLHTEEEKIMKAAEVVGNVVNEKFPNLDMESLAEYEDKNPDYLTKDKMEELSKATNAENDGGSELSEVIKILNGTENDSEKLDKAIDKLSEIEKKLDEDLSDDEARLNVIKARRQ